MNTLKLVCSLFIMFSGSIGYAQDNDTLSLKDFQTVKDTLIYETKIGDILNGIVDKKITLDVEEIDQLIKIGEKLNSNKGLGTAYRVKGALHKRNLEYLVAIKNFEKAITYFKKVNRQDNIARTYNDIFVVEYIKGNLDKGVSYLLESKKYFEQLNDSLNLAFLHNNLGAVYWTLKDYTAAEEAFSQSLKLQEHSETFRIKGTIMNNLANIYLRQEEYEKAKQIIEKSILFNKKNKKREFGFSLFYVSCNLYGK